MGQQIEFSGTQTESNREHYTVIGILPKGFVIPSAFLNPDAARRSADPIFIPWIQQDWHSREQGRAFLYGGSFGKLKPGTSINEVRTELKTISERSGSVYPNLLREEKRRGHDIVVWLLRDDLIRNMKPELKFLATVVVLLLGIGCVNTSGLVLSQNRGRLHEFAVRLSLGANSSRIIRQVIIENLMLTTLSAGLRYLFTRLFIICCNRWGFSRYFWWIHRSDSILGCCAS